jgi:hypothetical protein
MLGLQGQAEAFACRVNCPSTDPLADPIQGRYLFTYQFDSLTFNKIDGVAFQIDKSIECIPNGKGGCSNFRVELFGKELTHKKKFKKFLNTTCNTDLELNPGPTRSYFIVVQGLNEGNGDLNIGFDGVDWKDFDWSETIPLKLFIQTSKNLSWGPGNLVIKNVEGRCTPRRSDSPCNSLIPVANLEISTAVQFIQLGPCRARVRFADNKPLPFKQKDLICPEGVDPPTVSDVIPNEKVLLTVDTSPLPDDEEGYFTQSTNNQNLPENEPLTFVNEPVLGQVPVAFKTNFDSTYWTYIPGFGWILVTY